MKPKRVYTVMIIPHSEKEPITIKIPLFLIQSFFVGALLLFTVFLIGVMQFSGLKKQVAQLQQYKLEANTLKKEFAEVSENVIDLRDSLYEMKIVEEKIRVQAKLDSSEINRLPQAVGGPKSQQPKQAKGITTVTALSVEQTKGEIEELVQQTPTQLGKMENLLGEIKEKNAILAATPSIYPTYGRITSTFGYRRDPFTRRSAFHKGMDIANRVNTPIYATANGTVVSAYYNGGHGRQVVINHHNGIYTSYSHMRKYIVEAGDEVEKGQLIGFMGSTGRSTGSHLHYEILVNGSPANPANYLPY